MSARARVRGLVLTVLWLAGIFGAAGTLNWVRGWVYVALNGGGMAAVGILLRRFNPELLEARMRWRRKDTKPFDRIFMAVYAPLAYLQNVVAGVDAVRYRWSSVPVEWAYVGAALLFLGYVLVARVMVVNQHAETTVRIQKDRGHTVVSAGPYRWVRHPMYVGMMLMHLGAPLILGSLWALALTGVIVPLVVWRTALEDRTLQRELEGYREYASKTPYRLVPNLW
jgi:protein-S-isoprenylcysteine O-methyltransferase Ste14